MIQVGDLVDHGPDSTGVLSLVHRYLEDQPDQWIQLVGNHEAQYVPGSTGIGRADDGDHRCAPTHDRPEPLIWLGAGFATDTLAGPLWAEAGWEQYDVHRS